MGSSRVKVPHIKLFPVELSKFEEDLDITTAKGSMHNTTRHETPIPGNVSTLDFPIIRVKVASRILEVIYCDGLIGNFDPEW